VAQTNTRSFHADSKSQFDETEQKMQLKDYRKERNKAKFEFDPEDFDEETYAEVEYFLKKHK
jgi:hypothetical protein